MEKNTSRSNNGEPRQWPSERIAPGGMFHTPKVQYSKETADLIKLLMNESKMSMMMRQKIDNHMRNGEPLPKPEPRIDPVADPDKNTLEILRRARKAKRKTLDQIVKSGAYEPINYRPRTDDIRIPSEKAKKQLQEMMAGVRLSENGLKPKRRPSLANEYEVTHDDIINELIDQINERADWLAEMEALGAGKKYRDEMNAEISERFRRIKAIEGKKKLQKEGFRYIE